MNGQKSGDNGNGLAHRNGNHGRAADSGRFLVGNPGGPGRPRMGNPYQRRTQRLRAELVRHMQPQDIRTLIDKLKALAGDGDVFAIRELLDRTLGKSAQPVAVQHEGSVTIDHRMVHYVNAPEGEL